MSVNVVYTTSAIAVGGRDGNTGTPDGRFEVKLARPKELGGKDDGNNPEQLFTTVRLVRTPSGLAVTPRLGRA